MLNPWWKNVDQGGALGDPRNPVSPIAGEVEFAFAFRLNRRYYYRNAEYPDNVPALTSRNS